MRIAFYAPLKSPDHPKPSGDRQMARALIKALEMAGHNVRIVSHQRSFSKTPHTPEQIKSIQRNKKPLEKQLQQWGAQLWFSYHPYYKAPDFLGLDICETLNIPLVTAEASWAKKRDAGEWQNSQNYVTRLIQKSMVNFYFTDRDRKGLTEITDNDRLVYLPPFINVTSNDVQSPKPDSTVISFVTMGMMRGGVKSQSYKFLADSLSQLNNPTWQLTIIGDGAHRHEVEDFFKPLPQDIIHWLGELEPQNVRKVLHQHDVFLWPGFGEAYGLGFLEAQSCGLPVIALNTHGVPWVVNNGETGLLTDPKSPEDYVAAIEKLQQDNDLRHTLGQQAKEFVLKQRSLESAGALIDKTLSDFPDDIWAPLAQELEIWASEGQTARLWLRDDDAVEVTPALVRFADLCARFKVPYTLAVIPYFVDDTLAQWVRDKPLCTIAVHGYSHTNHALAGEKKCELGLHRGNKLTLDELAMGRTKLEAMFGDKLALLLVPPWNRIDADLIPHLAGLDFRGLSTYGWPKHQDNNDLKRLNTHVDIIDWKGNRGGLPSRDIVHDLVQALQKSRSFGYDIPPAIGILTHHLVHDEQAWKFLDDLMSFCAGNEQIIWQSVIEVADF